MVVCHCELVSDRTISDIVNGQILTVEQVTERCGAGGSCGGCHESIERLLAAAATTVKIAPRVAA